LLMLTKVDTRGWVQMSTNKG